MAVISSELLRQVMQIDAKATGAGAAEGIQSELLIEKVSKRLNEHRRPARDDRPQTPQ
ncbi:MAG TPA: hypothetical protein VGO17_01290 [Aurantimonas sp.]|nr:hypothetical protein [Aurantimonas sp.]